MTKVLITGGAGFIGFHLARFLHQQGYKVDVCDNLFRGRMDDAFKSLIENKNVHYIYCDLTKFGELAKLEKDYDYVYHLAAVNGTRFFYEIPHEVLRVNVLSVVNILDWFAKTKCKKILFSSSSETYAGTMAVSPILIPTPENVAVSIEDIFNERKSYAGSKIVGELFFINYAKKYKFDMSIVRYHNIYGPRMGGEHVIPQFISRILKRQNPFKILGGKETRAFCYVDDAIRASQLVMESPKTNLQIVNIGNESEEIRIIDLAKKLFKVAGYKANIVCQKPPKGTVMRRCPSIKKLKKLTGFMPMVDLQHGLEITYEWYKNSESVK